MNYEEIKQKYAPKVQERARKTANLSLKIERLKGMKEDVIEARVEYQGVLGIENRKRWDDLTTHINELDQRIEAAKNELADAQIGDIAEDVFNQMKI